MKNRIKIKSKTAVILSVLLVILVLVGLCVWYIAQQIPYGFPFGGKPHWISSVDDRTEEKLATVFDVNIPEGAVFLGGYREAMLRGNPHTKLFFEVDMSGYSNYEEAVADFIIADGMSLLSEKDSASYSGPQSVEHSDVHSILVSEHHDIDAFLQKHDMNFTTVYFFDYYPELNRVYTTEVKDGKMIVLISLANVQSAEKGKYFIY